MDSLIHGSLFCRFQQFTGALLNLVDREKQTIICGDFNFDGIDGKDRNVLIEKLNGVDSSTISLRKFKQIVKEPTTFRGYCIDHIYHNFSESDMGGLQTWPANSKVTYKLHHPYYSDHEALCIMLIKPDE